jgi:hypothetical protein
MLEIPKEALPIKSVRYNVEELLMVTIQECWKQNKTPIATYRYIDEVIDWCEAVGIFDKDELRTIIINKLGDRINAKTKEINK